jgi:hypothetical protein
MSPSRHVALAAGSWIFAAVLQASEPSSAARAALLSAVAEAPALSAAAQRAEAAQARIDASGLLPDPEVEGMVSRMDGPMGESSTMFEVTLRQPLPRRGERAADRERATAGAAMAASEYALMAGEMTAEVAMALAEAEAAEARAALLDTQRTRLEAVLRTIQTRLAAGTDARLADRLSVETRLATMALMIDEERRMAADAAAEVRGRLGLPETAALPPFSAPEVDEVAIDSSAALRVASARADEAAAMAHMARASARPMTAVGLRLERERMRMGDEDTVGLAFMSEIPWRSRRYAQAGIRAAEAEQVAARADGESARFRIQAAVSRVARAERLAEAARRLSSETLGRLAAEYDALIRTSGVAGAGESAVFQTVELLEKSTDAELQVVQADLAARVARAELWRYLPAESFVVLNRSSSTQP